MGTHVFICKMKGYIQPFERRLALMELESVAQSPPVPESSDLDNPLVYRVTTPRPIDHLSDALTYWETISTRTDGFRYTRQVRREATVSTVRNGSKPVQLQVFLPFDVKAIQLPSRRILRYGPHGAHEYRGKFFPQLVRALLNVAEVKQGDMVIDPMCGSGTTLVEASLMGCEAFGADMNPLSVLLSRAKCNILKKRPDALAAEYESAKADVLKSRRNGETLAWLESLPLEDRAYLKAWFSPRILADLDPIATRVHTTHDPACRDLFRLCLSNILRRISWQKEADLRIRKEIRPDADLDVVTEFVTELGRSVGTILSFLFEERAFQPGRAEIIGGDARALVSKGGPLSHLKGRAKVIVTSPPYATALPYLDTDRLSLCYLGLLSRREHRVRDYEMIGNREVTESRRRAYWSDYQEHRTNLPKEIVAVIDRIHRLNESADVGFRRRNLPALLARYFLDMQQVFQNMIKLLKRGAPAYVVIGNNHTIAGGKEVDIETDRLLGLIGRSVGLILEQTIPMEMLVSRDIFKKNAVSSETVLCFRK
jgi:hypothetical protein